MDLQHSAMYLLIFMVGMNAFATILADPAVGIIQGNIQQGIQGVNTIDLNDTVTNYQVNPLLGWADFGTATVKLFSTIGSFLIWGAPALFINLGIPSFIVTPLFGIWILMWFIVIVLYWIGGRQV
jgi:hypothetical protein